VTGLSQTWIGRLIHQVDRPAIATAHCSHRDMVAQSFCLDGRTQYSRVRRRGCRLEEGPQTRRSQPRQGLVHQRADFELESLSNRKPVELFLYLSVMESNRERPEITRAAALISICRRCVVPHGMLAYSELQ
jgi:hypothetical protein